MYYTVITKSAWTSDNFKVYDTYTDEKEAKFVQQSIKSPHSKDSTYYVMIKKHRKPIKDLTTEHNGWGNVEFSDGTRAER